MTWPKPGDHPNCCENGKGTITFEAAEGDDPRVRGDEGFAAWTIPFYMGGVCLSTEVHFCPFCGEKLSPRGRLFENGVRDPDAPCEEFERGIPKGTPHDCDGDGHYICAECVAWNGGHREPHDKYAGEPAHAAAGWHPDDDGHG